MPDGEVSWTRWEAAELKTLRSLTHEQALRTLFQWLLGPRVRHRKLACAALATQGEPVVSNLVSMLQYAADTPEVQRRVLEVLAQMNLRPTRTMAEALDIARASEDPEVRRQAAVLTAKLWSSYLVPGSVASWDIPQGFPVLTGGSSGYPTLADLL